MLPRIRWKLLPTADYRRFIGKLGTPADERFCMTLSELQNIKLFSEKKKKYKKKPIIKLL